MRGSNILLLATLLGCGSTLREPLREPESTTTDDSSAAPIPELPGGECGGFASLGRAAPIALLADRLRLGSLVGMERQQRAVNIMAAPPPDGTETRLFLALDEDRRFVVMTNELFVSAGNLLSDVRELELEDASVHRLPATAIPAVVRIPAHLDTSQEAVEVLQLFTKTRDNLVQSTSFYVTPEVAETGGCRALALALAHTVEPGGRELSVLSGSRTLLPGLGLTLPEGFHLTAEGGHDFSVYRVHAVVRLGEIRGTLGIYVGGHPSGDEPGGVRVEGTLLGQPVEWQVTEVDDVERREALVEHPNFARMYVHVFLVSHSSTLQALLSVAESLTIDPPVRPLVSACSSGPAPRSDFAVVPGSSLEVLMDAQSFTGMLGTWERPVVAETAAFRSLMRDPDAAFALRHLALNANTVEGRLYGLAGLRVVDEQGFNSVLCVVRGDLSPSARALTECGTSPLDVAATIESDAANAIRGEPHWRDLEWTIALGQGTPDIRGGALPRRLLQMEQARGLARHAARLEGTGFIPPLRVGDPEALPMLSGERRSHADPSLPSVHVSGGCAVRRDGRVACWGGERPGPTDDSSPESVLLPDVLRFPRDLDSRFGGGCMLDAAGTRVCWGDIEHSARLREAACGGPPAPAARLVLQRNEDGPWERLVPSNERCAIHTDGSLHCFVRDPTRVPSWATLHRQHRRYRIPF